MTTSNTVRVSVVFSDFLLGEYKVLKKDANSKKNALLMRVRKIFKKADLSQLNHTVSAEDLEFRKALFPKYRFWMRDVKVAGKEGLLTYQEVIDLSTFARSLAVQVIGELRIAYPATKQVNVEELQEKLAYERSKREEVSAINCQLVQENQKLRDLNNNLSEALQEATNNTQEAIAIIEKLNNSVSKLSKENFNLKNKVSAIQAVASSKHGVAQILA